MRLSDLPIELDNECSVSFVLTGYGLYPGGGYTIVENEPHCLSVGDLLDDYVGDHIPKPQLNAYISNLFIGDNKGNVWLLEDEPCRTLDSLCWAIKLKV